MTKRAVSYAIIRFQPHVETEEFANVGVVLVAPRDGFLDFRLETSDLDRLTSFFDSVAEVIIRNILESLCVELTRIKEIAGQSGGAENLFQALTKAREGVVRFSEVRFAMADSPEAKLDELFGYYVRRNVACLRKLDPAAVADRVSS